MQYLFDWGELKVWVELFEFLVGSCLLELAVTLGGVEDDLSLEIHRFCSRELNVN